MKWIAITFLSFVHFSINDPIGRINNTRSQTRRILNGKLVADTRPYMVYLRPASDEDTSHDNWVCGGVIIHERYILTSAACIEDIQHFYVVSGTNKWVPREESNQCIQYGAKKAVWKCVSKNYVYDGAEVENIRWMYSDIAVVKVEDDFNFKRRVKGCDYIPRMIAYNNQSDTLEKPKTNGIVAGWGSTEGYGDDILRKSTNSPELLAADVVLISKSDCKKLWDPEYHYAIDEHMICTEDYYSDRVVCNEQGLDCKDVNYGGATGSDETRRSTMVRPGRMEVHGAWHLHRNNSRRSKTGTGGFCENDHGGPLIVGQGKSAVVVGVISACQTNDITKHCYGPFLYTSVWKNRHLISCAINKEAGASCRNILRSSNTDMTETVLDWSFHPDGPAKRSGIPIPVAFKQDVPIELPFTSPIGFRASETTDSVTRNTSIVNKKENSKI